MPKVDHKLVAVARVYSRAMYELATARGEAASLLKELMELAGYVERDADFAAFLASPLIDVEERTALLEKLFRGKASHLLVDSLQVLNRKGRLGLLSTLAETYRLQHQETLGRIDVHVTTAVPLTDRLRKKLKAAIRKQRHETPELIETIDESLIGGIVVQIGDEKADASVVRKIDKLRKVLHQRSVREIHRRREHAAG